MRVLNKLGPNQNFIAIETPKGEIIKLEFVAAEQFSIDLNNALYDRPPRLVQDEDGDYRYE